MEKIIKSPFTEGNAALHKKIKSMTFRKEEYDVYDFYYKCEDTGKEFSTTETGDLTMKQLYNRYREKNDILFPDQIISLREKYGLSSAKMSSILGFGPNIYKSYEKGDIPNKSNSTLLNVAKDPKQFYSIAEKSKQLSIKELNDLEEIISKNFKENSGSGSEKYLRINSDEINQYTGYVQRNFEKFANMVLFFIEDGRTFATRLNKYLFYSDFRFYSMTGSSISGYSYCAIDNGPVPDEYKRLYWKLWEKGFIDNKEITISNKTFERFVPAKEFNRDLFTQKELKVIKKVYDDLRYKKTEEIIELSHKEKGWIENEKSSKDISYQEYAFELESGI